MEQYPIPQFIEQEGKIAFFISFRQFFYLVGAGAICFVLYFILPFFLFFILSAAIMIGAAVLAFVTINGAPIINIILNSLGFIAGAKNYTWKKKESLYPFKAVHRAKIKELEQEKAITAQRSQLRKAKNAVELRK